MDWIRPYIGLPFAERGRDERGVDCWGLVCLVYARELGITLPSFDCTYRDTCDHAVIGNLAEGEVVNWRPVALAEARPFDVLLFRMPDHGCGCHAPGHVGLLVAPGLMLHVLRGSNASLEPFDGLRWKRRLLGIYRHPER